MKDLVTVKLNTQLKSYLKKQADKQKTTITGYVESLILKDIFNKKGSTNGGK